MKRGLLLTAVALAVAFILCSAGYADRIMIGNAGGEIFGREELNLSAHIATSYTNFGPGMPISALAGGVDRDVAIGLNFAYGLTALVRKADDLGTNITQIATGSACGAIGTRPDGHVIIGDKGNLVFMRDRTDLTVRPPGYTGVTDGLNFNAPITAVAGLSNGNIVIANSWGEVFIRQGNDIAANPVGSAHPYVNYGTPVTSVAVLPGDRIAIALNTGWVDIRPWTDLWTMYTGVNFGIQVNALAGLPNGNLAIGLADGSAHVRSGLDLVNGVITWAQFTGGAPVTALAATSNNNLAIGTGDNLVFVRDGSNLLVTPPGFVGPDGLNFNAPITALAAVIIPEPSSLAALALGVGGLLTAARRRR